MKHQFGKISSGLILTLSILGILGITVISLVSNYYSYYGYRAKVENQIKAEYSNMENILAQYSLKVSEAAQVPGQYAADLKDVVTSEMTAKMGEGGSKAMMQWFKERNINIDSSMYTKIQQIIEAGRNKFENAQTKFIDVKRGYQTKLDNDALLAEGWWLKVVVGAPKIDLDKYKIISSGHARDAFETGVDKGLNVFGH